MKREFLKNLGIEGEIAEQIMTHHGKVVEKVKSDAQKLHNSLVVSDIVKGSGARSEELLTRLLGDADPDLAKSEVEKLQKTHPWLFKQSLPVFSASCEAEDNSFSPFRHGAGL